MDLICPQCKQNNETSQLIRLMTGFGCSGNTNSFIDELGKEHNHSYNPNITVFRCSNGHESVQAVYNTCWACNAKLKEDVWEILNGFGFM